MTMFDNMLFDDIAPAAKGHAPTLNPDGVSVKGCSIIYAPAGQAGEYAALACNPYRGCGHKCAYCYVPRVLKITREEFDAGANERKDFLDALTKDARKYKAAGVREQVMLSFTTDPFHPGDNSLTRQVIRVIQQHGMGICTLTKGGSPTLAESSDVHGGSKAQEFTAAAFNDRLNYPTVAGIAGAWYRFSTWGKRTAGTGTDTRVEHFQTSSLPGTGGTMSLPITSATYAKKTLGFISTSTNSIFCYPAKEAGSSAFDTVIVDDGTLERLTYSTLFSMITTPVSRLATVKIQPDTFADGTLTGVVHWADASASPTTYLLAWSAFFSTEATIQVGLLKCVAGTYTALIAPAAITPVANAWLEIRAVDNDTVGLYYNNIQRGTNQDVTDVTGSYCGQVITGGNNLKSFFVG